MSEQPPPDRVPPSRETETDRLERNWSELLQELRVTQTGTQILTGFLLTLAFQPRFADLDQVQIDVYLVLVVLAALTTALALAPVSLHRYLFREGAKAQIVRIANVILKATLVGVALVLTGTVMLIFDVVVGVTAGFIAGAATLLVILAIWIGLPMLVHPDRRP
jgi:amino acid permease